MNETSSDFNTPLFMQHTVEIVIRVGLLILVAAWCFDIVKPFIGVLAWAIIIAIALAPLFERLQDSLGGRRKIASMILTLIMLVLLITPTAALFETLVNGSQQLASHLSEGDIQIPAPPARLATWPLFGKPISEAWLNASENFSETVKSLRPQIKSLSVWLLSSTARTGFAILTFVVAIIIAGVLLVYADKGHRISELVFRRLAGERGEAYLNLTTKTTRSVAQGILGVALIQSILAGLGFLVAGIPAAGVLAMIVLFLCIVQLGPLLILLPSVIYMFMTTDTLIAALFLVWAIFVALIDNVLKPLLLGRGVDVPVLVVFIGAIGGFVSMGIIGLFVGSIVLVLGYTFLIAWLDAGQPPAAETSEA